MPGTAGPPTVPPLLPLEVDESGGRARRPKPSLVSRETVFAWLGLVAALFTAYQLDALMQLLRFRNAQMFEFLPMLWAPAVANIVFGFALMLLVWWLGRRAARRPWIGVAYIIAGIAAVFYLPLLLTFNLHRFGVPVLGAVFVRGPLTYWSVTGTVLAVAGLLHLLPRSARHDHG